MGQSMSSVLQFTVQSAKFNRLLDVSVQQRRICTDIAIQIRLCCTDTSTWSPRWYLGGLGEPGPPYKSQVEVTAPSGCTGPWGRVAAVRY